MKCELCGTDPATLHVTELVGGKPVERHYCKACGGRASGIVKDVPPGILDNPCDQCGGKTWLWFKDRRPDGTVVERRLCEPCADKAGRGRESFRPVPSDDLVLVPRRWAAS
jgi:protein-arginine kinase activator protein McsA